MTRTSVRLRMYRMRHEVLTAALAAAFIVVVPQPATAQWDCAGGACSTIGNVGIGTSAPERKLHVEGFSIFHGDDWGNNTILLRGQKAGAPYNWGEYSVTASYAGLSIGNTQTGMTLLHLGAGGGTSANAIINPSGGNVGIGTWSPQYKLSVNGTIGTKEVVVTNAGWADHVLRPDYRLKPLTDVAAYIREHGSLPEIASAKEVEEKGVSLGEMQVKLLAKIEELTLHLIQLDERNRQLEKRIEELTDSRSR